MVPDYTYVAFLDLLGYRGCLEADRNKGRLALQTKLSAALRVMSSINTSIFQVRAISDTIIITCTNHKHFPTFLKYLREIFIAFLREGLYIRGGVAYGLHFESSLVTYSHALTRAYELETNIAIYPRIVIENNIVEMYRGNSKMPKIFMQKLLRCENGVTYLNILTSSNWNAIYEYAKIIFSDSKLTMESDERAFSKHLLFERYLMASKFAPKRKKGFIPKGIDI